MTDNIRYATDFLKHAYFRYADALLLTNDGIWLSIEGLGATLKSNELSVVAFHKDELPARKTDGVVYLRPFADTAVKYNAPFGADTIYAVAPKKTGKTGAYKLPAPKNR